MEDEKTIISPDTKRKNRLPPGQHGTEKWPVLHSGQTPNIDIKKWTFEIFGRVKKDTKLSFDEFMDLPRNKVRSDIHCVTTWSRFDNLWEGVSGSTIADIGGVLPEAKYVIVHAALGFTTNLNIDDFLQNDVVFAIKHDGKELEANHGYPTRLVVPQLYFWKSAKWVTGVEFSTEDKPGFWETRGYHNRGNPWKEERYS